MGSSKSKKQKHNKGSHFSKNKTSLSSNISATKAVKQNNTQVPTEFILDITMLSDWHIGNGAGRVGDIDSLVQRDYHGLPYIPAKTLTGIWRDACELVATGLDNGIPATWTQWVIYLFGDQPALEQCEM